LREANSKIKKEQAKKENRYEYQANVNHAIGVLKDRLIGILIADDRLTRNYLYRELVSGIKRRLISLRPTVKCQERILEKISFPPQSQIKLLVEGYHVIY
jgi:hypothetical protein